MAQQLYLTEKFFIEKKNDGNEFQGQIILQNRSGFISLTDDSLANRTLLVFKYSYLNCDACVEKQIELLNEYSDSLGQKNICIISDYEKMRDLIVFEKNSDSQVPINRIKYGLDSQRILSDHENPYFFIMNGRKVEYTFIPLIEMPDLTKSYLSFANRYINAQTN